MDNTRYEDATAAAIIRDDASAKHPHRVTLETPLHRGADEIKYFDLRKPDVEALRGLQGAPLAQMDFESIVKLIPRISSPILTPDEVSRLSGADLMAAGVIVLGFLFPAQASELKFPTA